MSSTKKQIVEQSVKIRQCLREVSDYFAEGNLIRAYNAAERAQSAAHDLKSLLGEYAYARNHKDATPAPGSLEGKAARHPGRSQQESPADT
jgi:hypothetical protein